MIIIKDFENYRFFRVGLKPEEMGNKYSVYETGAHFVQAASVLAAGEVLGWRMECGKGRFRHEIFTSNGAANRKDLAWLAAPCGVLEGGGRAARRVTRAAKWYEVLPTKDPRDCTRLGGSEECVAMLREARASACILSDPALREKTCSGALLLRLPERMPLRLKSFLHGFFCEAQIREIGGLEDLAGMSSLRLGKCFELLLLSAMESGERVKPKRFEAEFEEDCVLEELSDELSDEPEDKAAGRAELDENSSIEMLELSVRAYNSLRRAGIGTLRQLLCLTMDDLMEIRNLGRKAAVEVMCKIEEYRGICTPRSTQEDCMAQLSALVGIEEAKEQVKRIAALARLKKDRLAVGLEPLPIALNMAFVGNPGTAKTTAARLFAGILKEIGLLDSAEMIEVGRSGLVAEYVGQTAIKVRRVFEKAHGRVLFIDEAYSLLDDGGHSFGDEAIAAIVQEMENRRDDTVVIFAGYPDEMSEFFSRNPGLRSRVPFTVAFQDYSAAEMLQIAEFEAKKRGFSLDEQARERVLSLCEAAERDPESGNGRFCRNLVESAILCYAARAYSAEGASADAADCVLTGSDFSAPAASSRKQKRHIGFVSQ